MYRIQQVEIPKPTGPITKWEKCKVHLKNIDDQCKIMFKGFIFALMFYTLYMFIGVNISLYFLGFFGFLFILFFLVQVQ